MPQFPLQQSAGPAHATPGARHIIPRHALFTHMPEQHWSLAVHRMLSSVQPPAHVPPLQMLEQHSRAAVQLAPAPAQDGPHTPFSHESPWQQPSLVHASFSWAHDVQSWLSHVPLQQSVKVTHLAPPGEQLVPPPAPEVELLFPQELAMRNIAKTTAAKTTGWWFTWDSSCPLTSTGKT
jgi:hypothetical protein